MGQKPPQPLTLSVIKKVYSNWRLWVFLLPYVYATCFLYALPDTRELIILHAPGCLHNQVPGHPTSTFTPSGQAIA